MIAPVTSSPPILDRLRSCLLAPQIAILAQRLLAGGYSRRCMERYLRTAGYFSAWLEARGISPTHMRPSNLHDFHRTFILPRKCGPMSKSEWITVRAVGHHLMHILRESQEPKAMCRDRIQRALDEFRDFLQEARGLRANTTQRYCRYLDPFLREHLSGSAFWPERIAPQAIRDFAIGYSRTHRPDCLRQLNTALRAYYRFLIFKGRRTERQLAAVPCIPSWRTSAPPRVLDTQERRRFLHAFDRSSPRGKRDYAMAVCMLELGLRCDDVAALELAHIDWHRGVLTVPNRKQRRPYPLPLTVAVGQALAEYIRDGRPSSALSHVFLCHSAPRKPLSRGGVCWPINRAFLRAGIAGASGTHILRGSIASRIHAGGAGVKEIADFLGHASLETAGLSARTDERLLRAFALPWPEDAR